MRTLLLCAVLFLTACGGASAAAKPLSAGQSATVGGLAITYTGARIVPASAMLSPDAGQQLLAVDLTVTNRGHSAAQIYVYAMVAAIDRQNQRWPAIEAPLSAVSATGPPGIDGVLPAGDTVSGTVVIPAPVAAAPYRLRYTAPGSTQTATWAVSLP